jgi:ketosteroid isomerase-like protein
MGRRNLDSMRAIDAAWNRRQWGDYAAYFAEDLVAWITGELGPHGKGEHVLKAQQFCAAFPDCQVRDDYLEFFLSLDGQITCTVALLSGTHGARAINVPFSVICKWRDGRVAEQREFFDRELFDKQLGTCPESKGNPT